MTKNQKVATAVREHLVIAFGLLLYALAWNFFLFPHQVAGGGATGIAALVMYATQGLLPEGVTSIKRRIRPDFASVIFTGLFVPINKKHLNLFEYVDLNFSLTVISS